MSSLGFNNINTNPVKQAKQSKPHKSFADLEKEDNTKNQQSNEVNVTASSSISKQDASGKSSSVFTSPKPKRKPIQYGNIRVNKDIVNKLKKAQYVDGFRSRSDLLKAMFIYCKPVMFKHNSTQIRREIKYDKINKAKNQ